MRLEYLCTLRLSYDGDGLTLVEPFGGNEAQGFGTGTGRADGDRLSGPLRWANYPRRTDSGVLLPDVRGVIVTTTGPVLFELRGYSTPPVDGGERRTVTAAAAFRTSSPPHRWLNTAVGVHDGTIDFGSMSTEFPTYVCEPTHRAG